MKEKENINENKQELESKDLESSTNTKEIKQDSKNNTETKNKNSKNNTESIKLDSSGDEIIWESKINAFGILSLCIFFVCKYIFLVYVLVNDSKSSIFYWYCIA